MARFNTATLEVRDLNKDMAISTMKRGPKRFRFTYSLDKTLLRTYTELLERAYKYIRTDEGTSDWCQTEEKDQKKKQKKIEAPIKPSWSITNKRASPCQRSPRPNNYGNKYDFYTPLSALHVQILLEIEGDGYL